VRLKLAAAVVAGAVVLLAGLALAIAAAQDPSPPPTLTVQTPIGTVTGEECVEHTKTLWDEPPEGVVTDFEAGCVAYIYPVTTP
jgi:hypothetical protein